MRFFTACFFCSAVYASASFAQESCNEWIVAPIDSTRSGAKIISICYEKGNVRVDRLALENNPERENGSNNTSAKQLGKENLLKDELALSPLAIERIESVISALQDPSEARNPTEYELSKKDVANGFWAMAAAIISALAMLATVGLLWWNAKQFQTANGLSRKMADVAQKTMTTQLRPVLSMISAEIDDVVKLEDGTVSATIIMTIENTGHSEAEIISGWVSVEKSYLQAWGNEDHFKPDVIRVDRRGPSRVYLNRGNTVTMICLITIEEIPDSIPEEKVGFNIMAGITSKDICTLENEDCVRITYFNPVRTMSSFSEIKKEWAAVNLVTEIGNSGDRIITEEDVEKIMEQNSE